MGHHGFGVAELREDTLHGTASSRHWAAAVSGAGPSSKTPLLKILPRTPEIIQMFILSTARFIAVRFMSCPNELFNRERLIVVGLKRPLPPFPIFF